jgi:CBS domain-containing protein
MMARHGIHAVVVLGDDEEGAIWGVVSDVDVLSAIARRELALQTAGGAAVAPVATVSRSDSLVHAAELMREHLATHLVVVADGRPVGVLSTLDLAVAVAAGMVDERRPSPSRK